MQPPYRQVISIPVPAEGEGCIRKQSTSAPSAQGPFPSAHAHTGNGLAALTGRKISHTLPAYRPAGTSAPAGGRLGCAGGCAHGRG